jgi:hypothetical protein
MTDTAAREALFKELDRKSIGYVKGHQRIISIEAAFKIAEAHYARPSAARPEIERQRVLKDCALQECGVHIEKAETLRADLAAACKERDAMRARVLTWADAVRALAHATNDSWRRAEAIRLFVDMKSASTVRAADGEGHE